ncbi:nuclear transport factor 2 family protein [Pedobacter montanisoli]|uniref:Nuclear transport factor 2 family protein n=1 Tax=Pedobacter montanisoli TaxID=2923277 RepID=A0ABS9ZR44_9SPHI|nr:nuclear transport factor 2 family protein [Pedobacter montanisoli]MCJ0741076.1 nuclear transport factor 2 family protein [Pedobacter montanisoli]
MNNRLLIIQNYIEGYNQFDIEKMIRDFENDIVFQNVQNGEITLSLEGIEEFKQQAEQACTYFSERQQIITSYHHQDKQTEIEIDYQATLAIDLPNGMKKGDQLRLKGKSIFEFSANDKIIKLTDIS